MPIGDKDDLWPAILDEVIAGTAIPFPTDEEELNESGLLAENSEPV